MDSTHIAFFLLICLTFWILKHLSPSRRNLRLPPGPRAKPLIGNLLDLPPANALEFEFWARHKDLYGPISSLRVLGQTIVIINDARVAFDLLEKRSTKYSNRPSQVMSEDLVAGRDVMGSLQYNSKLRAYRKGLHSVIGSKGALSVFHDTMKMEARRFCFDTLEAPEHFLHNLEM